MTVADSGVPSLTAHLNLTVNIDDVNDNSPVFDTPMYNASIVEGLEPGSVVVRVIASDADEPNSMY